MSIDADDDPTTTDPPPPTGSRIPVPHSHVHSIQQQHDYNLAFREQQQSKASSSRRGSRESSVEPNEAVVEKEKEKNQENSSNTTSSVADQPDPTSVQLNHPARRLSVQDRINLFENKQKESSGSGGKPVVTKSIELKRLSSDVSSGSAAAEKAVLRRWSGASDMSIDLSGEQKDNFESSPLCTPSSYPVSQVKSEDWKDTASSVKPDQRIVLGSCKVGDSWSESKAETQLLSGREEVARSEQLTISSDKSDEAFECKSSNSSLIANSDDQTRGKTQSRLLLNLADTKRLTDRTNSGAEFMSGPAGVYQPKFKGLDAGEEPSRTKVQAVPQAKVAWQTDKVAPQPQVEAFAKLNQIEFQGQNKEIGVGDRPSSQKHFRAAQRSVAHPITQEGSSGSKIREAFTSQYRGSGDSSSFQPGFLSFVETEEVQKKVSGEKLSGCPAMKFEDPGAHWMKFERPVTTSEQIKKAQGSMDDSSSFCANDKTKTVSENQQSLNAISTEPTEHVQRSRQSKGNQDLNDELKMKASELEKLFAEHKLKAPGDQSNSTRRSRPIDRLNEPPSRLSYRKPSVDGAPSHSTDSNTLAEPARSSKTSAKYNEFTPVKMADNQNFSDALTENFVELRFSEGSRGKFYGKYMQKRDAKLREEWGSKGMEKEAKLKAMQDTLERSRAEMKAKFSRLTDIQDSVSSSHRRAEKLRSFNSRSIMRRKQQQLDFGQSDDDGDASGFRQKKDYGEDESLNETSFMDSVSRSSQSKKLLPVKSLSSSTPRTPAAPVPRSSIRAPNSSGRRKMQSENSLAQSVPNFSDLRKENTKPYSVASKTTRPQMRSYDRSKSTSEEMSSTKEEKPSGLQSSRNNLANPVEFRDMSIVNCEGDSLTTLKFDKEEINQTPCDKYAKNWSKPFTKKGSDIDFGIRAPGKNNMAAGTTNAGREYQFVPEEPIHFVRDEEEELEKAASRHHSDLEDGEPELHHDSENVNFELQNGGLRSFPHVDDSFVSELPRIAPPNVNTLENVPDSPGESPVSWNSRAHNPFAYPQEMSDIDASVDYPAGSPASWNSHSLSQNETDARMRKKWGMAQKPMLAANSLHNQSRKDMSKGFKRLLNFGRKSRGADSLVDWISATTSEGDDDTEDGRDPSNKSSEDLRRSRMGSLQGHPLDDGFNDNEFFSEQVQSLRSSIPAPPVNFKLREDHLSGSSIKAPRSFFSLSSFRSKASDSKPR